MNLNHLLSTVFSLLKIKMILKKKHIMEFVGSKMGLNLDVKISIFY